ERLLRPLLQLCRSFNTGFVKNDIGASLSPQALSILCAFEEEIHSLARAFKLAMPGFGQLLADYCEARGDTLLEKVTGLSDVMLPDSCDMAEDVKETLVLLEELARVARVPVPVIDSVIELASAGCGRDLRKEGR